MTCAPGELDQLLHVSSFKLNRVEIFAPAGCRCIAVQGGRRNSFAAVGHEQEFNLASVAAPERTRRLMKPKPSSLLPAFDDEETNAARKC